MEEWTAGSLISAITFAIVTLLGAWAWVKSVNVSVVERGTWFVDRSANARWGLIDVLLVAFLWLASQALTLSFLLWYGDIPFGVNPDTATLARMGAIIGIVQLLVISLALVWLATKYGHDASEFGLTSQQLPDGLRRGVLGFLMWIPVVWLLQTILVMFIKYSHTTLSGMSESGNWVAILYFWISAVLVAPVVEEILFRGIIQGWLQRVTKSSLADPNSLVLGRAGVQDVKPAKKKSRRPLHWPAILITSLLFGLAHLGQGPAPVSLFVLSLGLGYLYQRSGSLVACIVAHMMLNAITMLITTADIFVS